MGKNLAIYKSSAGSGKTFTLATAYLLLALRQPLYFRHILAVTFTNKATAEMKVRVIEFLHRFANDNHSPPYAYIKSQLGYDDARMKQASQVCLQSVLHNYHFFAIQTIDSFFQRVVRSFARESGLAGGYQLELNTDKIKQQLIDEIMLQLGKNKQLDQWLTEFSFEAIQDGKWDIRKKIATLADEIFKENFLQLAAELPSVHEDIGKLTTLIRQFQKVKSGFENFLSLKVQSVRQIMDKHQLSISDFYNGNRGVLSILKKIDDGKYEASNTYLHAVLEGNKDWYAGKASKATQAVVDMAVAEGIEENIRAIVTKIDQETIRYNTAKAALADIYTLALLTYIKQMSRNIQQQEEYLTNQDISEFLNSIVTQNDSPFIYEKIGTRFHHYLLDEFQDTSGMQWQNIRPLLKNSLAEGYDNLIVGDVKQSVYRWRSGNLELLLEQVERDIGSDYIMHFNLDSNFRSKKNIIDFNNHFFRQSIPLLCTELSKMVAGSLLPDHDKQAFEVLVNKVEKVYGGLEQKQGKISDYQGYVSVRYLSCQEDETYEKKLMEEVSTQLEKLKILGVEAKDIGVLVRNKRKGAAFIEAYYHAGLQDKFAPIISQESLFLKNANSIKLLIYALRYVANEDDEQALIHVAYYYSLYHRQEENFRQCTAKEDYLLLLPGSFGRQTGQLRLLGLLQLIEQLLVIFRLEDDTRSFAYLAAFQSWALEFVRKERADLTLCNEWWADDSNNPSIEVPDQLNAIQVMTIHKSKGLQFKVVIIPFLDWDLDEKSINSGFKKQMIWANTAQEPFDQLPWYILPYAESGLANSYFNHAYYEERIKINLDNLNLLYVALTRAEDALLCYANPGKSAKSNVAAVPKEGISRVDHLFYTYVQQGGMAVGQWSKDMLHYQLGDLEYVSPSEQNHEDKVANIQIARYNSYNWEDRVQISKQSPAMTEERKLQKVNRGLLIHDLLSRILHKDQAEAALENMVLEGKLSKYERKDIAEMLRQIFTLKETKRWFGGEGETRTEAPVLLPNGNERRLDRVWIDGDICEIIDYKTGQEEEEHHKQVLQYMKLMRELGYRQVRGFLLYTDTAKVEEVIS